MLHNRREKLFNLQVIMRHLAQGSRMSILHCHDSLALELGEMIYVFQEEINTARYKNYSRFASNRSNRKLHSDALSLDPSANTRTASYSSA